MLKRTLYFSNPAYLSCSLNQLNIKLVEEKLEKTVPIEDIGIVILDHPQITITQKVLESLLANNVALITCNERHLPTGLMLNLDGNTRQSSRFKAQINASEPLKKQLWQQTVIAKIKNQAELLFLLNRAYKPLTTLTTKVKSGDTDNCEATAAAYYWKNIFRDFPTFKREREGDSPNHLLNYGYSILRGVCARSLVGSGLLPTLGIFHKNQYNSYCLADDIMEPYRPFVDQLVNDILEEYGSEADYMNKEIKKSLLSIPVLDVLINGDKSPLMNAMTRTTKSLVNCYEGTQRKIIYPEFIH